MQCCDLLFAPCNCTASLGTEWPFMSHQMNVVVSLFQRLLSSSSSQVSIVNRLLPNSPLAVKIANIYVNAK